MMYWFFITLGFVALTVGAEWLVRGLSHVGLKLGVSRLTVGLILASLATSAPELAVSLDAAWANQTDVAVGNILGSNILNVLLVLGICAVIRSLSVDQRLVWRDIPFMILVSFLLYVLAADAALTRVDGTILLVVGAVYLTVTYRAAQRERASALIEPVEVKTPNSWGKITFHSVLGLILLVVGARFMVVGASEIARALGISELIIGLTVVAIGTSLPELATSAAASLRGERDIAVGNVVGSNIFNILWVLGLAAFLAPSAIPVTQHAIVFDFPVMCAVAVACLPIFFTGHRISRWEGMLFLAYYAAYVLYLFLDYRNHEVLPLYNDVMWFFVLPITLVTLVVGVARHLQKQTPNNTP